MDEITFEEMEKIDEVVRLTEGQEAIIGRMWQIYVEAQGAGIAFAVNENSNLVAYNALDIADCSSDNMFKDNGDFECADLEGMREVFPVWDCGELWLRRKYTK